jgi:hypothetical protein
MVLTYNVNLNTLIATCFSFILTIFLSIFWLFYFLNNKFSLLELELQQLKQNTLIAAAERHAETKVLNSIIADLKKEVASTSTTTSLALPTNYIPSVEMLHLLLVTLAVIAAILGLYYGFQYFTSTTIVGKLLAGANAGACAIFDRFGLGISPVKIKTFEIPFDDFVSIQIQLREDNDTCAILYKFIAEDAATYLPFEIFLQKYKDLLTSVDVNRLQNAILSSDGPAILSSLNELAVERSVDLAGGLDLIDKAFS